MDTITQKNVVISEEIERIRQGFTGKDHLLQNAAFDTGLTGLTLFYSYYARYTRDDSYLKPAMKYLEEGLAFLSESYKRVYATDSLDNHLGQTGRMLLFLKETALLDVDTDNVLPDIDAALATLMKSKIEMGDFDYNSGALAAGHYFMYRYQTNPLVAESLGVLVRGLRKQAFTDDDGDYYWKSPSIYNRVYIGISHGSAAVMNIVSSIMEAGIEVDVCRDLLEKTAHFVSKQMRTQERGIFPLIWNDKVEPKQFALCYGDLGTAYGLYRAAVALQDATLKKKAEAAMEDCLLRSREDGLTLDAGFIYGAAGVAAMFEKVYEKTNDTRYLERADYWYRQIPFYGIHGGDYAGYRSRLLNASEYWHVCFGWGVIGIGTALMRYDDKSLPPLGKLLMIA
ncbi:lanthionine synthetase LanC family protein [Chitinophaga sp.]|uniref:lanthionine synthetase LanC family protein n=1 Tax=Chitinophaga sp. TaxID=1869181 RepID=UPI0031D56537